MPSTAMYPRSHFANLDIEAISGILGYGHDFVLLA